MSGESGMLGPVRVWALAAGGMVGGGIYIALGVVVSAAAQWAWLAFLIAGIVACISAHSYARLSNAFGASGGAFDFLEERGRKGVAGSLSWLLILGYTLTIALYAYAFGHYVAYAVGGGDWTIRALAICAGLGLTALNLFGLGKMTSIEIVIVSGNLLVLVALAIFGLAHWDTTELTAGIAPRPVWSSLVGAAAIFVSYEGFQLLTYDYDEMDDPKRFFVPVLTSAAVAVVAIYIAVALGATMLAGALTVIEEKQIALSVAAEQTLGAPGLVILTIAAGFATAAAINSTLFSTGKLARRVASDGELPAWFDHKNSAGVPDRPIILIGLVATVLAVTGSLSTLVEAASLVFLVTFVVVNLIATQELEGSGWLPWTAIAIAAVIGVVLFARLAVTAPVALAVVVVTIVVILAARPLVLQQTETEEAEA